MPQTKTCVTVFSYLKNCKLEGGGRHVCQISAEVMLVRERSEIIRGGGGRIMIFCALKKGGLQFFQLSFRGGS